MASAPTFTPDEQVAKIASAYALDAVDIAAKNFKSTLDWSEGSITAVEGILSKLHSAMAAAKPPDGRVWTFAKAFGSYVGEVFRMHHGGEW